jgi:hypothetical protein
VIRTSLCRRWCPTPRKNAVKHRQPNGRSKRESRLANSRATLDQVRDQLARGESIDSSSWRHLPKTKSAPSRA